jgi:hypothetical protein
MIERWNIGWDHDDVYTHETNHTDRGGDRRSSEPPPGEGELGYGEGFSNSWTEVRLSSMAGDCRRLSMRIS